MPGHLGGHATSVLQIVVEKSRSHSQHSHRTFCKARESLTYPDRDAQSILSTCRNTERHRSSDSPRTHRRQSHISLLRPDTRLSLLALLSRHPPSADIFDEFEPSAPASTHLIRAPPLAVVPAKNTPRPEPAAARSRPVRWAP